MGKKILRHIAFLATGLAVTVVQAAVPPQRLPSCKDVVKQCNDIGAPPADKNGCEVYKANTEAFNICQASYHQAGGDFDYCWATCANAQKNHINIGSVCQGECGPHW